MSNGWNFNGGGIWNEAQSLTYFKTEDADDQYYIDLLSSSVNVMSWSSLTTDLLFALGEDEDGMLTPYIINLIKEEI